MSNLEQFERHIVEQARAKGVPEDIATRKFRSFEEYAQEASDKLGLEPAHDSCRAYASIKLSLDQVIERQMVNKPIDPADHLKLIQALKEPLPAEQPRQHTVKIVLVEGHDYCPKCKETYERVCPTDLVERDSVTPDVRAPVTTESDAGETSVTASEAAPLSEGQESPAVPDRKVPRFAPPTPDALFSACNVVTAPSTSDRWSK